MANKEINDLTNKTTPISTDEIEIQETGGGTSMKATLSNAISKDSAVTANTAKTGITAGQASAITANTAKVTYPSADSTKVGYLAVTQAVNLDTMESDIATNNAKISYTDATDVGLNTTHRGVTTGNPHSVSASDVGLGNVDNTTDISIIQTIYPVGAIYISTLSTNPNTLLGFGTWATFGAGRVLVSLDSGDTDWDTSEETGGAKTHTLAESEMPSHTHNTSGNDSQRNSDTGTDWTSQGIKTNTNTKTSTSTGGGSPHSIVQPYITVYIWKRSA